MAPGCGTNLHIHNMNAADTVDSFEILEQTVMKQKRLAKKKKCDLRLRILLKRTFDLVCEIMDRENGFDDDYNDNSNNNSSNLNNENLSNCSETITTIERPIESIPLPADDYDITDRSSQLDENIQLVPNEVIKLDNNKEYHLLTNVQTDFLNEEKNNFKRKLDDYSQINNKKIKLLDVGSKVNNNEV